MGCYLALCENDGLVRNRSQVRTHTFRIYAFL